MTDDTPAIPKRGSDTEVIFRLRYSHAQQVFLIGAFNNWSTTAHPMRRTDADRWETQVSLPPGCHCYCYFVIDEQWFGKSGLVVAPTAVVNEGSIVHVPTGYRLSPGESLN